LVQAYSDVIITREMNYDSTTTRHKNDSIIQAYGYDSASFDRDLRSMSRTPKLMKSFYDSVMVNISKKRQKKD